MSQATESTPRQHRGRVARPARAWLAGVALAFLATVVYLPALKLGFILFEDGYNLVNNLAMRSLSGRAEIWLKFDIFDQYYPLTFSSYWVEYQLWGADPRGYHFVNLLLHAISTVLIWRLLVRNQANSFR